jgi:hypothetical protein
MSRIPHFLDTQLTDGDDVVSLTLLARFTPPDIFSVTLFLQIREL